MVHISEGYTKIGKIPNISFPPVISCPKNAPCKKQCYAMKAFRMYPSVRKNWNENFKEAYNYREYFFSEIMLYLQTKKPKYFRWHVSGDILDQSYLNRMKQIAKSFPNTRFLCFTKMHDLSFKNTPKNLSIVLSMWTEFGNVKKLMPRAWMNDGSDKRIPKTGKKCGGSCENCKYCFSMGKFDNVVFDIH